MKYLFIVMMALVVVLGIITIVPSEPEPEGPLDAQACEQRGGEVVNMLGGELPDEGATSLGEVEDVRCPCECVVFESDEVRQRFEDSRS